MTTVVNIKNESCDVFIGRKEAGMHFGNPFSHLKKSRASVVVASRDEAILCFQLWINGTAWQHVEPERRQWILDHLHELKDKKIGCFCSPLSCHGDVYVEMTREILPRRSMDRIDLCEGSEPGSIPGEAAKDGGGENDFF